MSEEVKKARGFQVRLPSPTKEEYTKRELYDFYKKPIAAQVSRYVKIQWDVEDITHNVFVKILRNWHKFVPKNAGGWVALITQNEITDHFKRERNRPSKVSEDLYYSNVDETLHDSGYHDPALLFEYREALERLGASMMLIKKDEDRNMLIDKEYNGYSTKELMKKYGYPKEGGLNEKIFRVRKSVKKRCGPDSFLPRSRSFSGTGCIPESELCTYDESHGLLNN